MSSCDITNISLSIKWISLQRQMITKSSSRYGDLGVSANLHFQIGHAMTAVGVEGLRRPDLKPQV